MERTEKRQMTEKTGAHPKEEQIDLIEKSPLEEAWENVLEIMNKHLGEPTVNSWLKILHLVGHEGTTLTYRAPSQFIADTVEAQYRHKLFRAWESVGYDLNDIRFEVKATKKATV